MNEFSLIDTYFKNISPKSSDILVGIGDDAACLSVPPDMDLLVSTDTLVEGVHFLKEWDPFDIAYRSLAVNVSDIVAMGAKPKWVSLALTLPLVEQSWLQRFSQGLKTVLAEYQVALIGGDVTKGSLVITLSILGLSKKGGVVTRSQAKPGDGIFVTNELGGAAFAVASLKQTEINSTAYKACLKKLLQPKPRIDFISILQQFASAAIDISDGLEADLYHILECSGVGAYIELEKIPVNKAVLNLCQERALDFALTGGDDYELCFTVPEGKIDDMLSRVRENDLRCYQIGTISKEKGLRAKAENGQIIHLQGKGYAHF